MTPRQSPSPETVRFLLPQLPPHRPQRGETPVLPPFPAPLPLPGISSRFKHSPDFSGIQSESVPALRPTARPHIAVGMHALACTGMHYHRRPFSAKAAHRLPRQSARKTIFRPVTCSASLYKPEFAGLSSLITTGVDAETIS